METDADAISKVPEATENEPQSNRVIISETIIIRIFLLIFASIALMINNILYVSFLPLALAEYSDTSTKDLFYFYGILFASKDITVLIMSAFTGYLIDLVDFDDPLFGGFGFIMLSTILSAFADGYWLLFANRILQGLASAFSDVSVMSMVAALFTERRSRVNAFVMVYLFASLALLVAAPFATTISRYLLENRISFLGLGVIVLINGLILFFLLKRLRCMQLEDARAELTRSERVPMWRLLIDFRVIICAGSLMVSQTILSFLMYFLRFWKDAFPAISANLEITCFTTVLAHILGIAFTLFTTKKYPGRQWLVVAGGTSLVGVCGLVVPFVDSYIPRVIATCGIAFGVALIRIIILPTLARLADAQVACKYGSAYAIAYISYAIVDVIAPITLYQLISDTALPTVFLGIALLNILYAPFLYFLRNVY